jgi:bifunctional DNA-binding transcriptional regulator/antitoxin component of YhaV-PrlF toxin-antitoxin module
MSRMVKTSLDSKGRLLVPLEFRNILRFGSKADVFVQLDEDNERMLVSPATGGKDSLIIIELSDAPGSLAKAAQTLFECGADLITTESRAVEKGKRAVWRVVANTRQVHDLARLKRMLLGKAGARSVKISKI